MIEIAALDMAREAIKGELEKMDDRILGKKLIYSHEHYCEAIGFRRGLMFADAAIVEALNKVRET